MDHMCRRPSELARPRLEALTVFNVLIVLSAKIVPRQRKRPTSVVVFVFGRSGGDLFSVVFVLKNLFVGILLHGTLR